MTLFRRYLRIRTVQPEPDYGENAGFRGLYGGVAAGAGTVL